MTRRLRSVAFVALMAIVSLVGASGATLVLDFPVANPAQEHSQWCWAGVSQAMLRYYGTNLSQCEIANWALRRNDCCSAGGYSESHACNTWNWMWGTGFYGGEGSLRGILVHWGIPIPDVYQQNPVGWLSPATAIGELNARRPFVIRFGWKSNGVLTDDGHFLVGYGHRTDGTYLDYWDPLPGNGSTRSLYTWVQDASDHTWTHTLRPSASAPLGVPPVFTDNPLVPGATFVRAAHITELRQRINELRDRYAILPYFWTDSTLTSGVTPVKAVHLQEMRAALATVYTAAGLPVPTYTSPSLGAGSVITAQDVMELRAAVLGIW